MVAQLRTLRREAEIRTQEALFRDQEIANLKKEIRVLQRTCEEKKDKPRVVSDVPIKTNIVVREETRRLLAPERGGVSSGSVVISASESEKITGINKQISELAARRRYLRSNRNPNQGGAQALGIGRGISNQGTRPRLEEFPSLSPGMAPGTGDRGKDRGAVRLREPVRVETPTRGIPAGAAWVSAASFGRGSDREDFPKCKGYNEAKTTEIRGGVYYLYGHNSVLFGCPQKGKREDRAP